MPHLREKGKSSRSAQRGEFGRFWTTVAVAQPIGRSVTGARTSACDRSRAIDRNIHRLFATPATNFARGTQFAFNTTDASQSGDM
jgi:hypothetical protein